MLSGPELAATAAPRLLTLAPPSPDTRIRTPLPSKTHGPASLRGVIGPSWPLTGAPVGEGVLAPRACPWVPNSWRFLASSPARCIAAAEGDGIGTGFEVAFGATGLSEVDMTLSCIISDPLACVTCSCDESSSTVRSPLVLSFVTTGGARDRDEVAFCSLRLRADSLDRLGKAASAALGSSPFCTGAPCWGWSPSSESSCSHSSGSSTSASRSAAARQLGQMKIGYDGEAKRARMHL